MTQFPKGFYWGAATAAYQVEGGNDKSDWEQYGKEGRVPLCGRACDHYNRYESDFDIAKELGHNAHRFSIEWSRIEPEEGKFDEREVEHYRNVIRALKARGLRPYTTLWHFTLPIWFQKRGGFERADAPELFARYAGYIAAQLGDDLEGISTMNEPNVYVSLGWMKGLWPPFKRFSMIDRFKAVTISGDLRNARPQMSFFAPLLYLRVCRHLAAAHNAAYDAIKAARPDMEVSIVKHVVYFDAVGGVWNTLRARVSNYAWTHAFIRRVYRKCDSIGLNFYHHVTFGDTKQYEKTDIGWDARPEGVYHALALLSRYQKPLFVSEAGIADEHDRLRGDYIRRQVHAVGRAIADGMDVRGHMYWSLLDNYEWAFGFRMRFGLIAIDYETLERKPRPSAYVYKEIIERNGIVDSIEPQT